MFSLRSELLMLAVSFSKSWSAASGRHVSTHFQPDNSFSQLQITTRLPLMQDTQSASPARHPQPISGLGCIPRPHGEPQSESSAGPMRACRRALYRWDHQLPVTVYRALCTFCTFNPLTAIVTGWLCPYSDKRHRTYIFTATQQWFNGHHSHLETASFRTKVTLLRSTFLWWSNKF